MVKNHQQQIYIITINLNQMINQTTVTQQKMKRQIVFIYQNLIKYGYPQLINKNIMKDISDIEQFLSEYLQPTPTRQNLIEWLILQVYPLYQRQLDKADKKVNKKRKMISYLWKLGIMPFSKHTKNLDYQKYLQGLIGIQNSINLIFNLCTLVNDSKRYAKSKEDHQFHYFLEDIYKNYDSLINIEYDPYKISFPAAYENLSEEQFNDQYGTFLDEKINKLKNNKIDKQDRECSYQLIFKEFQQSKSQFLQTYSLLIDKIKTTISDNTNLLQNYQIQQKSQSKARTINITSTLPKLYKQYKQKIRMLSFPASKINSQKQQIIDIIITLNQTVPL